MNFLLRPSNKVIEDSSSEYGSDLSSDEELIIESVLAEINASNGLSHTNKYSNNDQENTGSSLYPSLTFEKRSDSLCYAIEVGEQVLSKSSSQKSSTSDTDEHCEASNRSPGKSDTRSPLQRFRSRPPKNLTVTDLVTPAWCEIKYWYSLTKYGAQKETPAMKLGSRIHEKLESEVHTIVPVKVHIKEDVLGLRIWNIIQGLRTLRKFGLTRELQVWGIVDGQLVGGKIDVLYYQYPGQDLKNKVDKPESDEIEICQSTAFDCFPDKDMKVSLHDLRDTRPTPFQQVYICDVKTRSVQKLPTEVGFRSTKYQLMLYHRFLSNLITRQFDLHLLTTRYKLDPVRTFSDSFLAQLCSLDEPLNEIQSKKNSLSELDNDHSHSQEPLSVILANNNISTLWSFMLSEFQKTFPAGAASLSNTLKAEFRSNENGNIIGLKTFSMNDVDLTDYLKYGMKWWKGERAPQGVTVKEAFKCKNCEFSNICEWRLNKVEEDRENFILKRQASNLKSETSESI